MVIDNKGRLASGSSTVVSVMNIQEELVIVNARANFASPSYAQSPLLVIGEQINNDAVASKTETRIRDGMFEDAFGKTFAEATKRKHLYGYIGIDANANYGIAYTTNAMPYVVFGANGTITKYDY